MGEIFRIGVISNLYSPDEVGGYERLCRDVIRSIASRGLLGGPVSVRVLTRQKAGLESFDIRDGIAVERRICLNRSEDFYTIHPEKAAERRSRIRRNSEVLREFVSGEDVLFVWGVAGFDRELIDEIRSSTLPTVWYISDDHLLGVINPRVAWQRKQRALMVGAGVCQLGWPWRFERSESRKLHALRFHLAGSVIYCSSFMQRYCEGLGLFSDEVSVCRNEISRFLPPRSLGSSAIIPDGKIGLVFASRLVGEKDPITALKGVALLPAWLLARLAVVVVGSGDEVSVGRAVDTVVETLSRKGAVVRQIPWLALDDLRALLVEAEIFLFTSKYEPYALTLLEAMSAGMAVVATAAGGNAEAIRRFRSGILVRPGSSVSVAAAVGGLMLFGSFRRWLGRNAKRMRAERSFDVFVDDVILVLEREAIRFKFRK